jgi:hemolysin-activating ACP:hemolysin acyltransferase
MSYDNLRIPYPYVSHAGKRLETLKQNLLPLRSRGTVHQDSETRIALSQWALLSDDSSNRSLEMAAHARRIASDGNSGKLHVLETRPHQEMRRRLCALPSNSG